MCYGDIMPWIRLPRVQVNSLTDSMSDWISKQIYSHHRVQHTLKYLHTPRSCQFYPYRRPLTHLHGYIYTIVLMAMMQSRKIWVYKPQESSRMHKWNQTKRNKFMCVFYGLYCITGIIPTAQIIEALEFCIRNGHVFFSNCTEDSRKHYLLPGVLVLNFNGIRICTSLCLHMAKRSNIYMVEMFLHILSRYLCVHITFCWQIYIIHESDVTWA